MVSYGLKNILRISLPILASMLIEQIVGVTDVIFLGRLSQTALAASALGSVYFFALYTIISGFAFGAQVIMARRNGEGNYPQIGAVFYQGCFFLISVAIFLVIISEWATPPVLKILIKDPEVFKSTIEYINWRVLGLITVAVLMMFRSFFVAITKTFSLQISSGVMVLTNIFLNYVLIFGCFGFSGFGIKGAALASVFSEILAALTFFIYLLLKIDFRQYGFLSVVYRNFALLSSILKISVWTMLQQFVSVSTWFLFFIAVEHLGTTELAIANILKNSAGLPMCLVFSFALAAGTITSNLIGENKEKEVLQANREVIKLHTCLLSLILILFAIFYYPILRIYTDDLDLVHAAVLPYMTALLCYLPFMSGFIWFQSVSATGATRYAMFIELISMIFYLAFIAVFIIFLRMPLYICMLSDGLYNLVVFVLSKRFMSSLKWVGKKV